MARSLSLPKIVSLIPDEASAYVFLEGLRWPNGPVCPHCGNTGKSYFLTPKNGTTRKTRTGSASARRVWKCSMCRKQYSVLTGTIFHRSKIPVRTWVMVVFEIVCSKNGVSAREIERKYDLDTKTAWFMLHRLREAMRREPLVGLMRGTVVADETFIGGVARNMHASRRANPPKKAAVLTMINKETGEARSRAVPNVKGRTLKSALQENVHNSAVLHTDSSGSYVDFGSMVAEHHAVNHADGEYVRHGKISTNQAENFFSQLKRSLDGTHHHVSHEHLPRYLAHFDFLYTTRHLDDAARMRRLMGQTAGRRLSYRPLLGG